MHKIRELLFFTIAVVFFAGSASAKSVVRFVALGDAGEGNPAQFENAAAMEQVCAAKGCDFALYLGDNFYDEGVSSIDDPQFAAKFEEP